MVVSTPAVVDVLIEDLQTGCIYEYKGAEVKDCVEYFQGFFLVPHNYKVLNVRRLDR